MDLMEIINNADFATPYAIFCDPNSGCTCKTSYSSTCTCNMGEKCDTKTGGCFVRIK